MPSARQRGGIGPLERLAELGRPGRALAVRIDLVRVAGIGYHARRIGERRRLAALDGGARNAVYERIWCEAAKTVGARAKPLAPGVLEVSQVGKRARVIRQIVPLDDPAAGHRARDRALTHRLLGEAQVTVPEHLEFRFEEAGLALAFLALTGGPCVVGPAVGGDGVDGTTAGIKAADELLRARIHAARSAERLLIERQAAGVRYRLLLLDGELLDIVRTMPARLIGDGTSTIAELIWAENQRRVATQGAAGLARLRVDLDLALTLERAGLSLSSVPPAGRSVTIRSVTSDSGAQERETYAGPVAESVLAEARAAAEAAGLVLAGVDAITPDPTRPLREVGGVISEVRGNPGLHHHYLVANPERATKVAVPILERVLCG